MPPEPLTVFVVGPPAAGKSTIGRAVAAELGRAFRTIDDWTPPGEPMTDGDVDAALAKLLGAMQPLREIVEFSHHAYDRLIEANTYPIFSSAPKILVTAPLSVCEARNRARQSPVREDYVDRAWRSAAWLAQHEGIRDVERLLVIRTDQHSVRDAIRAAADFAMTKWTSS